MHLKHLKPYKNTFSVNICTQFPQHFDCEGGIEARTYSYTSIDFSEKFSCQLKIQILSGIAHVSTLFFEISNIQSLSQVMFICIVHAILEFTQVNQPASRI